MKHRNTVEFEVWGGYALFSDPVMRVGGEKCTLQIPTYEALKGILMSIYWKPSIIWIIDEVRLINPVQTAVKGIRPIHYSDDKNELVRISSLPTFAGLFFISFKCHFIANFFHLPLISFVFFFAHFGFIV